MSSSELLTTIEVAKKLGIKRQTLDMWRSKGRGPAWVKLGFNVRYRADDVEAYLAGLKQQDTPNLEAQQLVSQAQQRESQARQFVSQAKQQVLQLREQVQVLHAELERLNKAHSRLKSRSKKLGASHREVLQRPLAGAFERKGQMVFFDYTLDELLTKDDEFFVLSDDDKQWRLVDSADEITEHPDW